MIMQQKYDIHKAVKLQVSLSKTSNRRYIDIELIIIKRNYKK